MHILVPFIGLTAVILLLYYLYLLVKGDEQ